MTSIIYRDVVQNTSEWDDLRAGKWTASNAATIMGGLETDGLKRLVKAVAWGRVFGPLTPGYKSAAMERGHEIEPESLDWYSFERGRAVESVGFVEHGSIAYVGWSPDVLSGRGAVEAKNPLEMAWMDVKRKREVPAEYRWQCRWAMWVGELEWLDFLAYHPKAGGLIVECSVTDSEKQQMAERVALLEPRVSEWIEILTEKSV